MDKFFASYFLAPPPPPQHPRVIFFSPFLHVSSNLLVDGSGRKFNLQVFLTLDMHSICSAQSTPMLILLLNAKAGRFRWKVAM